MACILCIVTLMILGFAIQNIFGDTEHFLVSNSETGERRMWEETSMESRGRQKRNVGYQYGLTDDEIREVVSTHNEQRNIRVQNPTASNMRKMRWSPLIAENAQNYTCGCNSYHSPRPSRYIPGLGRVGENIWVGTRHGSFGGDVVSWFNEEPDYDYWTLACNRRPCGHYTQGAWHNSYLVGCGFAQCDEAIGFYPGKKCWLTICQYFHVGNYQGTRPYSNGTQCSNCPEGFQGGCDAGLCTPDEECGGETCKNGGTFRDDGTCTCDCPSGYEGAYCESTPKELCAKPVTTTVAPETTSTATTEEMETTTVTTVVPEERESTAATTMAHEETTVVTTVAPEDELASTILTTSVEMSTVAPEDERDSTVVTTVTPVVDRKSTAATTEVPMDDIQTTAATTEVPRVDRQTTAATTEVPKDDRQSTMMTTVASEDEMTTVAPQDEKETTVVTTIVTIDEIETTVLTTVVLKDDMESTVVSTIAPEPVTDSADNVTSEDVTIFNNTTDTDSGGNSTAYNFCAVLLELILAICVIFCC